MTYQIHTRSPTLRESQAPVSSLKTRELQSCGVQVSIPNSHLTDWFSHLNVLGMKSQLYALPQHTAGHYWTAGGFPKPQYHRGLPT